MSNKMKAIVDLGVIPKGWSLTDFINTCAKTGLLIVDTTHYNRMSEDDFGVKLIDEDIEIKDVAEHESI